MPRERAHYGVTLKDLLSAGYLDVDQELTCDVSGEIHVARLNADAQIQHERKTYKDPSPWVKSLAGGSEMRGWTHAKVGSETLLDILIRFIDVTLEDLLDAGYLEVGEELNCKVDRNNLPSRLNAGAHIEWQGAQYVLRSPWVEPTSGNGTKLGYTDVTASSGDTLLDLIKKYRRGPRAQNVPASQPPVVESLGAQFRSPPDSRPKVDVQIDPPRNLREEVAQLSPSEFKVLIRQYVEDKGFVGAEITVHLNLFV